MAMERVGELWKASVQVGEGTYSVEAVAVDGAKRREEKTLGTIRVSRGGTLVDDLEGTAIGGGLIDVYRQLETGGYELFDGSSWGQILPLATDASGRWAVQLPPGRYYMTFKAPGYFSARSNIFEVDKVAVITQDVQMKRRLYVRLGSLGMAWPDIWGRWVTIEPKGLIAKSSELEGTTLPFFSLAGDEETLYSSKLRGKPSVLVFVSTGVVGWEQWLARLDELALRGVRIYPVLVHKRAAQATLSGEQLGLFMSLWGDEQGDVAAQLGLPALPAVLVIDGSGRVVQQAFGFATLDWIEMQVSWLSR
jgi:hypothetical protein